MVGPEWWILALRAIKHLNAYARIRVVPDSEPFRLSTELA
jgi:hypothetical protein